MAGAAAVEDAEPLTAIKYKVSYSSGGIKRLKYWPAH